MNFAISLVILATSWYLLNELGTVLRPLLLAILLSYVVLPIYYYLAKKMNRIPTLICMIAGILFVFYVIVQIINNGIKEINGSIPELQIRFEEKSDLIRDWGKKITPWIDTVTIDSHQIESQLFDKAKSFLGSSITWVISLITDLAIVFMYLVFVLLEAHQFNNRIQTAFNPNTSKRISATLQSINQRMVIYLRIKIISSFILAAPVFLLLLVTLLLFWYRRRSSIL